MSDPVTTSPQDLHRDLHRLMTVDLPRGREAQAEALADLLSRILRHERRRSAIVRDADFEVGSETEHDALEVFLEVARWHQLCVSGGYEYYLRRRIKDAANRALSELLADEHGFREAVAPRPALSDAADLERYVEAL